MRYQPRSDAYTVHRVTAADPDAASLTELAVLDGWHYIVVPEGVALTVPDDVPLEAVTLDAALRDRIKAASPHCRLIRERAEARIHERYSIDHELYLSRISIGALRGTYVLRPGEVEEIEAYQAHAEDVRAWAHGEYAALGLGESG